MALEKGWVAQAGAPKPKLEYQAKTVIPHPKEIGRDTQTKIGIAMEREDQLFWPKEVYVSLDAVLLSQDDWQGLPRCFLERPEDRKLCSSSPNAGRCSTMWKTKAVSSVNTKDMSVN